MRKESKKHYKKSTKHTKKAIMEEIKNKKVQGIEKKIAKGRSKAFLSN